MTAGQRTHAALGVMMAAEIALAVTLVAGAGWLIRSFDNLRRTDPGFTPAGRLVFDVDLSRARHPSGQQAAAWFRELLPRLEGIAGVTRAGSTAVFPLRADLEVVSPIAVAGRPSDPERQRTARQRIVSAGFFEAMGTPVVSGRAFTAEDGPDALPVVVVNESFVRRFATGMDLSTLEISFGFTPQALARLRPVVGVVRDVKYDSLAADAEPAFYLSQEQFPSWSQSVVVSTSTPDVAAVIAAVRGEVAKSDPFLALDVEPVPGLVASMLSRSQVGMALMIMFGLIALTLAAIGIWLYEVRASDITILVVALAVVGAIALGASAVSARRASLVEPASALRSP